MTAAPIPVDPLLGVYESLGRDALARVVHEFYQQIPGDELLGPMYPPNDLEGAAQRLLQFLIFRCGGPADYIERRGHPALRMRHARFPIGGPARARWVKLMDAAFVKAGLTGPAAETLRAFLASTATFLINRPD